MTHAKATSTRFPAAIWDVPILRELDARARGEIEAAGAVRSLRAGEVVHRTGEPADALHVVAEGRFSLHAVRRGEASATLIRAVGPGETFGEEGTVVDFGVRQADARCDEDGVVADVPITVLRRALGRLGGGELAGKLERALRRAATLDLLRTTAFTRSLSLRDVEILLDAAQHEHVPRGAHVYRAGDPSDRAYLVADGLLQAQSEDDEIRVEAYLGQGDLFGDAELEDRAPRSLSVVAAGPAWLVAIPRDVLLLVARRNAPLLEAARRVRAEAVPPRLPGGGMTTAHVFKDLYRMRVARSLLVIDQDSCVRCGHCAWSCASVHDDGISRLVRHGERVVAQRSESEKAPLLVPNSCQHCKNPSCMIDCPTGAIGRDARGEVFIREELCTGCGSCAKACPWDNIAMAARADTRSAFPEVAVKCDLCSGLTGGPACVAACPTESIVRIDPNEALVGPVAPARGRAPSVDHAAAPVLPRRAAMWPWVSGAALAAAGLAHVSASKATTGWVAAALVVLLAAYAGVKRSPRVAMRVARSARVAYAAHLGLGALAVGAVVVHTGLHASGGVTLALFVTMLVASASGALGAALQSLLPPRLSRLERRSVLPEELAARAREVDERIFARLSGRSELVKTLYARVLAPYRRARLGALALVLSGRALREEERRVRAGIDALLEGKNSDRTEGLDDLVRLVVERRALGAQRGLTWLLRGWVPVHLAAAAAALALLVAHVFAAVFATTGGR